MNGEMSTSEKLFWGAVLIAAMYIAERNIDKIAALLMGLGG